MHSSYSWQLGESQGSLGKQMRKLYDVHWSSVLSHESRENFKIYLPTQILLSAALYRLQGVKKKGGLGSFRGLKNSLKLKS